MIQCNICGYRQHTKGRKDFKCKWCGHRIVVRHIGKENNDTEIWHGIHGQVVAPNGTFEKIFNDAKEDDYDI